MMIFGLLLELLLFVGVYLQKGDADDCNVIFQSKLNATMECFKTYSECFFDNLQARFPKLYNKTGWKREPPRDEAIKPSSFCEPDSKGVNQSGLHVYWKMPDSYNAGGIAGYEFHLELDPPNFRCLVVILHEKPTQFNRHFSLNITMFPVKRNQDYMIVLHSLPRANDSISSHKKVTSMNCKRGSSSADWTPAEYNDSYKWPEKILTIWFPPPPLEFNITRFQLDLLRTDILLTDSKPTTLTSNTTEVSFANQEPGNYTLYMRPYDEHPHDKDRCVCRDDENFCKPCQLTYWEIICEMPEEVPDEQPEGYLHEVLIGLGALLIITIVLVVLYKILARHFGIECVIGQNKTCRADILHVLCIDVNFPREDLSKFRFILENDLNIQAKFIRKVGISEKNASSKVALLLNQRNYPNYSSHYANSKVQGTDLKHSEDDAVSVLICFLVSSFTNENLSEYLSTVRAGIPRTRRFVAQICAVTFEEKLPVPQSKTALKCYSLTREKQDFVSAVKSAFPKQTMDQYKSVVYASGGMSPNLTGKNGITNELSHGQYINSSRSKTCNDSNCRQQTENATNGSVQPLQTFVPEVMFLGASESRRERYVSNDSGRGASVLSYKPGHTPEDYSPLWEDATTNGHLQCPSTNYNTSIYRPHMSGTECPSCDISFFPPDPSVISENSFDPNDIGLDGFDNLESAPHQLTEIMCQNCLHEKGRPCANSMESLMDKMAEINKRSTVTTQHDPCPGEVHSVWEGHV